MTGPGGTPVAGPDTDHEMRMQFGGMVQETPIKSSGWALLVGKTVDGTALFANEGVVPPGRFRRWLRFILLGERWVRT